MFFFSFLRILNLDFLECYEASLNILVHFQLTLQFVAPTPVNSM